MPISATDSELATRFLAYSRSRMIGQNWPNLRECVESLSDGQIWSRPNEASNSIGNLLLHLNGNLSQLVLVTFNGVEDTTFVVHSATSMTLHVPAGATTGSILATNPAVVTLVAHWTFQTLDERDVLDAARFRAALAAAEVAAGSGRERPIKAACSFFTVRQNPLTGRTT